jgi:hypothetical protein
MRNLLFLLGGGVLVYIYMCNSKKHKCNCEGDLLNDLTGRLNKGLEKAGEGFKEGVTQKDAKPSIVSTGSKQVGGFQEDSISDISYMDRGVAMKRFNGRSDFSDLYKRYNTKKSVTVSPSRVKVVVVE